MVRAYFTWYHLQFIWEIDDGSMGLSHTLAANNIFRDGSMLICIPFLYFLMFYVHMQMNSSHTPNKQGILDGNTQPI
jgi:hypothetical protein